MSNKKPEQYLVDSDFAKREIPNELDKRSYTEYKYIKEDGIYKIGRIDDTSYFNEEFQIMKEIFRESPYEFYAENFLWQVCLSKNPTDKFYNDIILGKILNTNYPYGKSDVVHRGHYLANKFKNYLVPKNHLEEQKVVNFFGRGNIQNVYPQSANSNCSSDMKGQLTFEQQVWEFLDKSFTSSIL